MSVSPIAWGDGALRILDQTRLPHDELWLTLRDHRSVAEAIRSMRVRGAPAIGVAAAYGMALAAHESRASDCATLLSDLRKAGAELRSMRPTAVNLSWAVVRILDAAEGESAADAVRDAVTREAIRIHEEDVAANKRLGALGAELLPVDATVLTHCNAGALATGGYGTALGIVRGAVEAGNHIKVFVDETRPLLQGARLTAWELARDGIECTLIVDSAAASILRRGEVDAVIVGADRIAANGDVANKIGTYPLALAAREHDVPFYVAAPVSTIDLSTTNGRDIPIEERSPEEISSFGGERVVVDGIATLNPAFDVTPHALITAIVTERGVASEPYLETLSSLLQPVEVTA
jgi:methylthioribose-1-phosphate isomerase